jgi:hypothetical protein
MADKKTYYKLDDIGFLGTQKKKSALQKKTDLAKTGEFIKLLKSRKNSSSPARKVKTASVTAARFAVKKAS